MRKETVDAIMEANDCIGLDLDRRDDYSGRGMYGSETAAIVGCSGELMQCIAQAAADIVKSNPDDDTPLEEFIEDIGKMRTDSMGRSSMVFY